MHRLGRLAAYLAPRIMRWRWLIVAAWAVAIAASALALPGLQALTREDSGATASSSAHAQAILKAHFGLNGLTEVGLIYEGVPPPAYRSRLRAALADVPGVRGIAPLPGNRRAPAIALERIRLGDRLTDTESGDLAARLKARLAATPPPPGVHVYLMGRPVLIEELRDLSEREVRRIERLSLVISLVVLLCVFGSLGAALLPMAMGLTGITITLGILVAGQGAIPVGSMTRLVTSIIAIAVGIDYALFIVSRYREERAAGQDPEEAVRETLDHTGGAIALSALVMATSVAALAIPDFSGSRSIALAIGVVLAIALATSFTLLPSLLVIGDRWLARPSRGGRLNLSERIWEPLATWVVRRHRAVLLATGLAIALLLGQLGHLQLWEPGPTLLPPSLSSRQGYDALVRAGLAGEIDALFLVVRQAPSGKTLEPATVAMLDRARELLSHDPRVLRLDSIASLGPHGAGARASFFGELDRPLGRLLLLPRLKGALAIDETGTYTVMRVVPAVGLSSPALRAFVIDLKDRVMPAIAPPPGVELYLGGNAARRVDFTREVYGKLPWILGVTVSAIYGLLMLYFRSIWLPAKAVLMNALPVLGATAVLVLVLQDGWGVHWLGLPTAPGAVIAMSPVVLFCLVFGLSMDYEVLILSRIQEAHARGLSDADAIREGMARTSGIVTGACAIMLSVFAPNMASQLISAKEFGLGLSTAVLLDATVVRLLLVPAFMAAMGRWNWWWPWRTPAPDREAGAVEA